MQKVVQAAGRVLRTPEDRGWLWLMDERYATPEGARRLPAWGVTRRRHRRPAPANRQSPKVVMPKMVLPKVVVIA
jgi:Rad3-related DNA helicase